MSLLEKRQIIKDRLLLEKYNNDRYSSNYIKACRIIDKMAEGNIPAGYWFYKIEEFTGSQILKDITIKYIKDIKKNYLLGYSICFAGSQGTGKTASSICILKEALKNNFSIYYITASDLFGELTNFETSNETKRKVKNVDFLLIDELDSRFFPSNNAKELFSSVYENIFRFRTHNNLPTIICTNETVDIDTIFYGMCAKSIKSLNAQYLKVYPVAGKDARIKNESSK